MIESMKLPYDIKGVKLPINVEEDLIRELLKLTRTNSNQPPPEMYS